MASVTSPFSVDSAPEVFFSTTATSDAIARAVRAGRARKLGPRLYTRTVDGDRASILRRNWAAVAAGYFPGAVISGRTALDARPAEDGSVFLTTPALQRPRAVELDGLRVRAEPGTGALDGDLRFMGQDVHMSSRGRAYLDNVRASRRRGTSVRRTLDRRELEDSLEQFGRYDEGALNRLRDDARAVAPALGAAAEFVVLDDLVGALLGMRKVDLASRRAQRAAVGLPYDPLRVERFAALAAELVASGLPAVAADHDADVSVLAFFESYFSNYIEGTEFTVAEARDIVFNGVVPEQRPKDAHDVLGTYRLVVDRFQRSRVPDGPDDLLAILRAQHGDMLSERPEIGPGTFKRVNNRVGAHEFVDQRLVEGTLREAWAAYDSLPPGFARAAFAMFLVAEVHPFADGNGRTARLLMNSELSVAGQQRIIVTTRRRGDYLSGLRGMSNQLNIPAFIATLAHLQRETRAIDWTSLEEAESQLRSTAAFTDPEANREPFRALLGEADL